MSESVRRILVAYDIRSDARRDRVAVVLQRHGDRIQFSVFLIDLKPADTVRLTVLLETLIDGQTDRILLCDLGPLTSARPRMMHLGRTQGLTGDEPALIL